LLCTSSKDEQKKQRTKTTKKAKKINYCLYRKKVRMDGEAGHSRDKKDTVGTEMTVCKGNRCKMNDR